VHGSLVTHDAFMDATARRTLIDRYRQGPDAVRAALDGTGPNDLDARPAPSEWTAREIVHHLADSETISTIRLRRLLAEDAPVIVAYDQDEYARVLRYDRRWEASFAVFAAVRAANAELLELLDEDDWARAGTHSEDGPYSIERWLELYAAHGHDHADQIREARASSTLTDA
jgi:hypothetical protein